MNDKIKSLMILTMRLQKEINILKQQNSDCIELLLILSHGGIQNMNDVFEEIEKYRDKNESKE